MSEESIGPIIKSVSGTWHLPFRDNGEINGIDKLYLTRCGRAIKMNQFQSRVRQQKVVGQMLRGSRGYAKVCTQCPWPKDLDK